MSVMLMQLLLFTAKAFILVIFILLLIAGILALLSKGKGKTAGRIQIKNVNEKYNEIKDHLLMTVFSKPQLKKYHKEQKEITKQKKKLADEGKQKNVFVLNFCGDIKASAVTSLREEVTAILSIATPEDEVVVCVESPGGMVHTYGLAAAQLARFREHKIPLTVSVDKVAASGGYLMACVANKILAAPFAIIGSIGVIIQMPNFNRLLKEKHIDFEQLTAGSFKRTLTMFGHNTEEGREKLKEEIEEIHGVFKDTILSYRPHLDMKRVATGEHWLGTQAFDLKLVDSIKTSDDYLVMKAKAANVYEISYEAKKSFVSKLTATANLIKQNLFSPSLI